MLLTITLFIRSADYRHNTGSVAAFPLLISIQRSVPQTDNNLHNIDRWLNVLDLLSSHWLSLLFGHRPLSPWPTAVLWSKTQGIAGGCWMFISFWYSLSNNRASCYRYLANNTVILSCYSMVLSWALNMVSIWWCSLPKHGLQSVIVPLTWSSVCYSVA